MENRAIDTQNVFCKEIATSDQGSASLVDYPDFWELTKSIAYHPTIGKLSPIPLIVIVFAMSDPKHPMLNFMMASAYFSFANHCVDTCLALADRFPDTLPDASLANK